MATVCIFVYVYIADMFNCSGLKKNSDRFANLKWLRHFLANTVLVLSS